MQALTENPQCGAARVPPRRPGHGRGEGERLRKRPARGEEEVPPQIGRCGNGAAEKAAEEGEAAEEGKAAEEGEDGKAAPSTPDRGGTEKRPAPGSGRRGAGAKRLGGTP